jgi:hypothetical protein
MHVATNGFSPDTVDESTPRKIVLCMVDKVQNAGLKSGSADGLKSALVSKYKKMGVRYQGMFPCFI